MAMQRKRQRQRQRRRRHHEYQWPPMEYSRCRRCGDTVSTFKDLLRFYCQKFSLLELLLPFHMQIYSERYIYDNILHRHLLFPVNASGFWLPAPPSSLALSLSLATRRCTSSNHQAASWYIFQPACVCANNSSERDVDPLWHPALTFHARCYDVSFICFTFSFTMLVRRSDCRLADCLSFLRCTAPAKPLATSILLLLLSTRSILTWFGRRFFFPAI